MKTAGFRGEITPDGQISVPPEVSALVPRGEKVQVVLRWDVSDEDSAWRTAGRQQFEAAYATDDAIYELLMNEPPTR